MNLAPLAIYRVRSGLWMLALAHAGITAALWAQRPGLQIEYAQANPGASFGAVTDAVQLALIVATTYHLTVALLDVVLLRLIWLGRGQLAATAVQVLAVVFSFASWWGASWLFPLLIVLADAFALVVAGYLWTPSAREFFRAAPPRLPSASWSPRTWA